MKDASVVAVQAGLHMGSEIKGTAFISGQGSRTIKRVIWHGSRALCSRIGIWYIGGHWVERCEES